MTLRGFARLFRKQGARWALNLDGGGSTTMVVRGRVLNRPSDGRERAVSSALVVLSGRSPRDSYRIKSVSSANAWAAAASDVASTGGLARMMEERGARLRGDLARAATLTRREINRGR
jgi:hypothetical protein